MHSLGQVIHFDSKADEKNYEWVGGVNFFLPKDIRMRWCQETKTHFHARYSALINDVIPIIFTIIELEQQYLTAD